MHALLLTLIPVERGSPVSINSSQIRTILNNSRVLDFWRRYLLSEPSERLLGCSQIRTILAQQYELRTQEENLLYFYVRVK